MITLKTARNRGNARIWLDRASCRTLAIKHGEPYSVEFGPDAIRLHFPPRTVDGRARKVAGSADRPVVDLCSRKVDPSIGGAERYSAARTTPSIVTIKGAAS